MNIRVIPCLDVNGGRVVKGVNFVNLRDAGDPLELALRYEEQGADELTFLDISATVEARATTTEMVRAIADKLTIPITVGGGVRTVADAERLLAAGATKVGVNSAAIARPDLVNEIVREVGAQHLVVALDVRRHETLQSGYAIVTHGGGKITDIDAVAWAREVTDRGATELLPTSMESDGTLDGFDLEIIRGIRAVTSAGITASGGAGKLEDFAPAVAAGATSVLAASVFHDGTCTVAEVKVALAEAGYEVRL